MKKVFSKKFIIITIILIFTVTLIDIVLAMNLNKKSTTTQQETTQTKEKTIFKDYNEYIEIGTIWNYQDFINNFLTIEVNQDDITFSLNETLINENTEYTFNTLGEQALIIESNNSSKQFTINIIDTTPPVINGLSNKTITEGEHINLTEGITATDNSGETIHITLLNETIPTKKGNYIIKVSVKDSSGNTTTGEYTLTITPKTTTTSTTTKKPTTTKNTTTKKVTTAPPNDASTKAGRLNLAKSEAKRVINTIITPGMSDQEKAYAIFNYLHSNVERQTNQSSEAYKTNFGNEAYAALIMKIAACSGFCKAVALLCNEAGLKSEHINANSWTHQWNRVLINGEWIILDAQGGIFGGTTHPLE